MTATYNLVAPQATTFTFQFQVKNQSTGPWNLTNYNATMTVRPFLGSTTKTLEATNLNGKIVIDGPNGICTTTFSALDTTIKAGTYVYDFVLDSGTEITRLLEGQFVVTAGVTV